MARKATIKAFAEWVKVEANVERVLELIASGVHLHRAAVEVKQPYTCLHPFLHSDGMRARYEAARAAWADLKQDEAMEIVDGAKPDKGHVAKAKLQAEVRQNQAKAYHRERWGERVQVDRSVELTVDAGLIGTVGELLKISAAKRQPRTIEGAPGLVDVANSPAALPAPAVK